MCEFFVYGIPAPQGSKQLVRLKNGRVMMIEASRRVMPWRSVVAAAAHHAKVKLNEGDVEVAIVAKWVRPASHLKKNGEVRSACDSAPGYADCDKIARAICDALAGIAYRNDRQVAKLSVERKWCIVGEAAGAFISVTKLQVSSPEALRPAQE